MKKPIKVILIVCASVIVLGICGLIVIPFSIGALSGIFTGLIERNKAAHWRENTHPISTEIVNELCSQFAISSREHVCKPGEVVYGPEFYPYIVKAFCPTKKECIADVDIVEDKIGKYKVDERPLVKVAEGYSYFVYEYDFQADRLYPLRVFFYSDGSIMKIQFNFGY